MQHPPYPLGDWLNDGAWVAAMATAAVVGWNSNLRFKRSVLAGLILLLISRLVLDSGGGFFLLLLELPIAICVTLVALIGLGFSDVDRANWSQDQRRKRRRKILRNWGIALGTLALAACVGYAGIHIRNFIRDKSAPRIAISENAIPFTKEITLDAGKAAVLILPNNKTLAIWCERPSEFESANPGSPFELHYGEQPFTPLEYDTIQLPNGGTTSGEFLSYIRQNGVLDRGPSLPKEFLLYVDQYRITLDKLELASGIHLLATVTLASEEEQVSPKQEVDYFAARLVDHNSDVRLDAISKLTDLLASGSIYAEPRETFILGKLKLLTEDPDPQVREQVADSLRRLGDAESILKVVQPLPSGRFLDAEQAAELGSSTKSEQLLLSFTHDPDPDIRAEAAQSLSQADSNPVGERMVQLLEDPDRTVRMRAIQGLDGGQHVSAVAAIKTLLVTETDPDVIRIANDALEHLQPRGR